MAKGLFHEERHSQASLLFSDLPDKDGKIFVSKAGMFDLSNIQLLAFTVDTVRQLYYGSLKPSILVSLEKHSSEHSVHPFLGPESLNEWDCSKMPKISGYRYKLQNNYFGFILLIGSYYVALDNPGSHLKIEVSPHAIYGSSNEFLQKKLDQLASYILDSVEPSGISVHLAVDLQGWTIPFDFQDRFVTHSRVVRNYDGISSASFEDLSSVSVSYGRTHLESIMFGKPVGTQTCIYDKSKEIIHSDKVDYFHDLWKARNSEFNPDLPVTRIEFRLHHSVVRDIGNSIDRNILNFLQVSEILGDLWKYSLTRNRLDYNKVYIDPLWQLLIEDAFFYRLPEGFNLKRKKKQSTAPIAHNIAQIIGNIISLGARFDHNYITVYRQIAKLVYFPDIIRYYESRGLTEEDLKEQIQKGIRLRKLTSRLAA